jgi:hypothetical protein
MYRLIAVLAVALLVVPAYAERTITLAPGQAVPLDWDTPDGSRSVTVYSNTTYSTGYFTSNSGYEVGDQATFVNPGNETRLGGVSLGWCDLNATAATAITVRFYEDAGMTAGPYIDGFSIGGLPGYGCWTAYINVYALNIELPSTSVYFTYDFGWTALTTESWGPLLYSPPTVGTTISGIYSYGDAYGWWGTGYDVYFGIDMVPEPATMLLLAGGAVALLRRR